METTSPGIFLLTITKLHLMLLYRGRKGITINLTLQEWLASYSILYGGDYIFIQ